MSRIDGPIDPPEYADCCEADECLEADEDGNIECRCENHYCSGCDLQCNCRCDADYDNWRDSQCE